MGKVTGFMEIERETPRLRPIAERVQDYRDLYLDYPRERLQEQAARCMDCGVPFCHEGCTLHNVIPNWNDLVYRDRLQEAVDALHQTNNFPEFTGRVCPALCEAACVVGINREPVTIREIEKYIVEEGFKRGLIKPQTPLERSGKRVAVIGSGPAGLAASQQLARAGHDVTLFEKNAQAGGLLRYGIPDFKLEKWVIDRRLQQMVAEGVTIRTGVHIGVDFPGQKILKEFHAVVLAGGSEQPRDLLIPGRELTGIHFAMDFLSQQNRRLAGETIPAEAAILATNRRVVVIGGGDTGADCVGTAIRQQARSVTQVELLARPPKNRAPETPWPTWPHQLRTSTSHMEGCERLWSVATHAFRGEDGHVIGLDCARLLWEAQEDRNRPVMREIPRSAFVIDADLILLAMGFVHPVHAGLIAQLGVGLTPRGTVQADDQNMTNIPGLFVAGDMHTGQSLVLRAIAGGRKAALAVDAWLRGGESVLEG
ncbi:MAG: glutamate synthase subunit beta [Magnetococcales bacterium]|nr:glutamate synthase subunit beta [Magnetococcales bacterium]